MSTIGAKLLASVKRALSAGDGRIGDDRPREERIKDGRHVGLDFYDLLIEVHYTPSKIHPQT